MEADQLGLIVSSELLHPDAYIPIRPITDNTCDAILNFFLKVAQSKAQEGINLWGMKSSINNLGNLGISLGKLFSISNLRNLRDSLGILIHNLVYRFQPYHIYSAQIFSISNLGNFLNSQG
jgi:hypothetical protein